jgi:hypothetical protein
MYFFLTSNIYARWVNHHPTASRLRWSAYFGQDFPWTDGEGPAAWPIPSLYLTTRAIPERKKKESRSGKALRSGAKQPTFYTGFLVYGKNHPFVKSWCLGIFRVGSKFRPSHLLKLSIQHGTSVDYDGRHTGIAYGVLVPVLLASSK